MVSRRRLLTLSSGAALGALAGCSSSTPSTSASSTPSASSPSAAASSATPSASVTPTPTPTPTPTAEQAPDPTIGATIATDLDVPWGLVFLRSGDALVGERNSGRIVRVTPAGDVDTIGELSDVQAPTGIGEGGLLGMALAPGDEGTLFAYITTQTDNRVIRVGIGDGLGAPRDVLTGIPKSVHHNGGAIIFDPDGNLMVATGDAEDSANAQDKDSLSGKILRIKTDGSAADGNPYDNRTWTYGHRNIEGLAFDADGRLWATEFGDKVADELNVITKGGNYGWPDAEGKSSNSDYESPKAVWEPTSSCSPAGLAITRSTAFVGALQGQCLFSVFLDGTNAGKPKAHFQNDHGRIRGVHVAPDGSLWMTTSNTDGRRDPGADDDKIIRVTL